MPLSFIFDETPAEDINLHQSMGASGHGRFLQMAMSIGTKKTCLLAREILTLDQLAWQIAID